MLSIPLTNDNGSCIVESIDSYGRGIVLVAVLYRETDEIKDSITYLDSPARADEYVIKLAASLINEGMEIVSTG